MEILVLLVILEYMLGAFATAVALHAAQHRYGTPKQAEFHVEMAKAVATTFWPIFVLWVAFSYMFDLVARVADA